MVKTMEVNIRLLNYQRLTFGIMLLGAYLFKYFTLAIAVLLLMFWSALTGLKYAPIYNLFRKLFAKVKNNKTEECCVLNKGQERFPCIVGVVFLTGAWIFFIKQIYVLAWSLILLVAVLTLIAGTSGFCLATVIYTALTDYMRKTFTNKNHREKKCHLKKNH